MLSISPMSAEKAEHYFNRDDYYLSSPGKWHGKGAEALGLAPGSGVEREAFRRLASGRDPHTKEQVIAAGVNGKHRAGYDLTFSAPKSVSILALLDPRIKEAHARAVDRALVLAEERYAAARASIDGKTERVATGNLMIARFDHMVSRELDPQLHTHAFVANVTRRADGKLVAIESRPLFEVQLFLGQMYRNEIALELQKLGYQVEVTSRAQGLIEITGVPRELIEGLSKRRKQVEERVREMEAKGEYSNLARAQRYEIAALGTRKAKQPVKKEELMEQWTSTVRECGCSLPEIREAALAAGRTHETPPGGVFSTAEAVLAGATAMMDKESVFRREDVERAALRFSIGEHDCTSIAHAFDRLAERGMLVRLGENKRGAEVWTTKEMLKVEQGILDAARVGKDRSEAVDLAALEARLLALARDPGGIKLTADQEAAMTTICLSRDTITLVQGDAGSGKTTMLNEVGEIHKREGCDVVGVGFTGKAAKELERGAGIQSRTIDSFLSSSRETKRRTLLIMDESSMTDSRRFAEVVEWANRNGAKLVCVGDRKQFQPIGAGRMFAVLEREGVKCVEMKENVRQKTRHARETADKMAAGDIEAAWNALDERGRIVEAADREARLETIKTAYLAARAEGKDTLVLTHKNEDRRELNQRIRAALVQRGEVEQGRKFATHEPAPGLDPATAKFADGYFPGQVLSLHAEAVGRDVEQKAVVLQPGARLEVLGRDGDRLIVQTENGERSYISPVVSSDRWTVLEKREVELGVGDRIVFLKNDRKLRVENGTTGRVERIDEHGNVQIKTGEGKTVKFNLNGLGERQYDHLTHGYAVTEHKSQGQTSDRVIWHADPSDVSRNAAYVASTRGREDTLIVTADKEALREAMKEVQEKTSTLDHELRQPDEKKGVERDAGTESGRGKMDGKERALKEVEARSRPCRTLYLRDGFDRAEWDRRGDGRRARAAASDLIWEGPMRAVDKYALSKRISNRIAASIERNRAWNPHEVAQIKREELERVGASRESIKAAEHGHWRGEAKKIAEFTGQLRWRMAPDFLVKEKATEIYQAEIASREQYQTRVGVGGFRYTDKLSVETGRRGSPREKQLVGGRRVERHANRFKEIGRDGDRERGVGR